MATQSEKEIGQVKLALTDTNAGLRFAAEAATKANDRLQAHESKIASLEATVISLREQLATHRTVAMWAVTTFVAILAMCGTVVTVIFTVMKKGS